MLFRSVYSWLRKGGPTDPVVVAVVNMTPVARSYRVGLPAAGHWAEILNTDAAVYGGHNRGNLGGITAEPVAHVGRAQSALLMVPPLSTVWLKQD